MPSYTGLVFRLKAIGSGNAKRPWDDVAAYLIDTWLDDYAAGSAVHDIVEVSASGFSYLFDMSAERLIAAWGSARAPMRARATRPGWPGTLSARGPASIAATP